MPVGATISPITTELPDPKMKQLSKRRVLNKEKKSDQPKTTKYGTVGDS
jgi:hypothetical protein